MNLKINFQTNEELKEKINKLQEFLENGWLERETERTLEKVTG
jgi:hypothetical protein